MTLHPSRFGLSALLVCTCLALSAPTASSQSEEYQWGRALMEDFYYEDLAETVFTGLSKSSSNDEKNQGLRGLALLLRRQARRADDASENARLNEEALTMFRSVVKNMKTGTTDYFETLSDLSGILQDVASEAIELMGAGRVAAADVDELKKKSQNYFDEAEINYGRIVGGIGDVEQDAKPELWILARLAELNQAKLLLGKAKLLGTDQSQLKSPRRVSLLHDALEKLDEFILEYEGQLIGMDGFLTYGEVKAEMLAIEEPGVSVDDVESSYVIVYDSLILEEGGAPEYWLDRAQYAMWRLFEFENKLGRTSKCIELGDRFRADWKTHEYEYNPVGNLALVELGKSYHDEGRSSDALEIAARVSEAGGFPGREADKLMSGIIRTALNKEAFDPRTLIAGANGAWIAGRKNPNKYLEAIELYEMVVSTLGKIDDLGERSDVGRLAWFRMGDSYYRLNRFMDAAVAYETGYRTFNNENSATGELKINESMSKDWGASIKELRRQLSGNPFVDGLYAKWTDYLIANPPKGVAVAGTAGLEWRKAEGLRKQDEFQKALVLYESLASKPSEFQERAIVKAAVVNTSILRQSGASNAASWADAAKKFEEYRDYVEKNPVDDQEKLRARRAALLEADFYSSECYIEAAKAADVGPNLKAFMEKVLEATSTIVDRTSDSNIRQHSRFNRFEALMALDRLEEAEQTYRAMIEDDPKHKTVSSAAITIGKALRDKAEAMVTRTQEQEDARNAVMLRAAEAYKTWLIASNSNKSAYWSLVYRFFYDLEEWQTTHDILDMALEKFKGTKRASEKEISFWERRQAHCKLELAKEAFAEDDKKTSQDLFNEAAVYYKKVVGPDNKAPSSVLEEAAEVFGGFIAGPNRRGQYEHFVGAGEFERAALIWKKVYQSLARRSGDDAAEERDIANRRERAKFYLVLSAFKFAKTNNDNNELRNLKRQVDALFGKTPEPGGPNWAKKYEWLRRQL